MGLVRVPKCCPLHVRSRTCLEEKAGNGQGPLSLGPTLRSSMDTQLHGEAGGPAVRGLALLLAASVALRPSLGISASVPVN